MRATCEHCDQSGNALIWFEFESGLLICFTCWLRYYLKHAPGRLIWAQTEEVS